MEGSSKLSEWFLKKAENELGETESTKQQGLEQLRKWIKNQPNIKHCRQGNERKN
jgi:hypothetical protein